MASTIPTFDTPQRLYQAEKFSVEWSKETLDALEPLLAKNTRRFVLFLIKYLAIWRAYKHAVSTFWIADLIDTSNDVVEWQKTCTDSDRRTIGTLLLLLDTTNRTHEKLFSTISTTVTAPEVHCFFGFQFMIENVHREALATLASTFLSFQSTSEGSPVDIGLMKSLDRKLDWITQRSEDQASPFSEKVLLFLFVQGLFSATAATIFKWVAEKDILSCLVYTYDKISADRETHINFASLVFYHLERRPSGKHAKDTVTEIVEIERSFAEELIRNIDGDIPLYTVLRDIESTADGLLVSLGYRPVYSALEDKGEVDKKVTGELKALYFEQEMASAYRHPAPVSNDRSREELLFDPLE